MGWLELLPLLKRALPLLSRVVPMLETLVASRGLARAELARTSSTSAEVTQSHGEVVAALEAQSGQLAALAEDVKRLGAADEYFAKRFQAIEGQVSGLQTLLKALAATVVLLLLVIVVLLVVLVHRHG